MAKSLRSKWKRKCRAIKRERYGEKELARLKKTLGIDNEQNTNKDMTMQDISDIVNVSSAQDIKEKKDGKADNIMGNMEMEEIKSKFNSKTLRNENGAYPIWLHPRKIKGASKKAKKAKGKGKINKKNK